MGYCWTCAIRYDICFRDISVFQIIFQNYRIFVPENWFNNFAKRYFLFAPWVHDFFPVISNLIRKKSKIWKNLFQDSQSELKHFAVHLSESYQKRNQNTKLLMFFIQNKGLWSGASPKNIKQHHVSKSSRCTFGHWALKMK